MTVEDPGEQDTPVDLDKLKASLGCPLCQGVYRFPVTVVRWTRGANARDARAFDALDVLSPLESTRTLRARARASSSAVARAVCQSLYSEEISPMSSNRRVTIGRESPRGPG